jgi:hypothetical protein
MSVETACGKISAHFATPLRTLRANARDTESAKNHSVRKDFRPNIGHVIVEKLIHSYICGPLIDSLAQLVEQQTLNLWVQGSIP